MSQRLGVWALKQAGPEFKLQLLTSESCDSPSLWSSKGHVSLKCVVPEMLFRLMDEGPLVVNEPENLAACLSRTASPPRCSTSMKHEGWITKCCGR